MRIGQVSEKYGISVDNLYYYIQYGLLVPPRPKSQYVFDEKTLKDLELVLELKGLDFSLNEIHKILSLYRVSHLADPQDCQELKALFQGKQRSCIQEKERLEAAIRRLGGKIWELSQKQERQKDGSACPSGCWICSVVLYAAGTCRSPKQIWILCISTMGTCPALAATRRK